MSLRDVAHEANVNLGLIHRYVGGKQDLLTEVLARRPGMPAMRPLGSRSVEDVVGLLLELIAADAAHNRVVVRAILDGFEVPTGPDAFPLIRRAAAAVRQELPSRDADVRVVALTALALGWQVMGPLLLDAIGDPGITQDELATALRPALLAFLSAEPPEAG